MQTLVLAQDDMINQIDLHVKSAVENTDKGVKELKQAVVYQVIFKIIQ